MRGEKKEIAMNNLRRKFYFSLFLSFVIIITSCTNGDTSSEQSTSGTTTETSTGTTTETSTGTTTETPTSTTTETPTSTTTETPTSTTTETPTSTKKIVSYSAEYYVFKKDNIMTELVPQVKGFNPTVFSISPNVPAGVEFDKKTGVMSGTPQNINSKMKYTITATDNTVSIETYLYIKIISTDIISNPELISFTADSKNVKLGNNVKLIAIFKNATGQLNPGNINVESEKTIQLEPSKPTTYHLTLVDSYENVISADISIDVYLEGKYTYSLVGVDPIESKYTFFSTGIGNFYWKRTFSTKIDYWSGTFEYTFVDNKINIYWKEGDRSGTHSYIDSYSSNNISFESKNYKKTSDSPY
jgi:hypothetical protein